MDSRTRLPVILCRTSPVFSAAITVSAATAAFAYDPMGLSIAREAAGWAAVLNAVAATIGAATGGLLLHDSPTDRATGCVSWAVAGLACYAGLTIAGSFAATLLVSAFRT